MPKLINRVVSCLIAASLFAAVTTATVLRAQTAAKPVETTSQEKKSVRLPFRGKVSSVDTAAMTITLDGKEKKRVIHVTSQTRIAKLGKSAKLEDAIVGEEVGGQALRLANGREEAISLRLGPKPETQKPGDKAAAEDEP